VSAYGKEANARQRRALGSIALGHTLWNLLETLICSHDCNKMYETQSNRDLMDVEEVVVGLMFRGNLRRSPRSRLNIFDLKISGCSPSSPSLISMGVCSCEAL